MFVPFITRRPRKFQLRSTVIRRVRVKGEIRLGGGGGRSGGGGGGARGGGGGGARSGGGGGGARGGSSGGARGGGGGSSGEGGSRSGSSGSRGGGSGGGSAGRVSGISTSSGGGSGSAVVYGSGGGKSAVISGGRPFAGRSAGGGTRGEIYGTSQYGSGYPGVTGRGTAGRGFPFYFWPVVWGDAGADYLNPSDYGSPTNTSRPGGPLTTAPFTSNTTNTTFRVLSDNETVTDLIETIINSCSPYLQTMDIIPTPYNDSSTLPQPEQAIQYYRASSIVLTLDGYNNMAVLTNSTSDVPLPSNIDQVLLDCLNTTIGTTAPLVNAASSLGVVPTSGLLGLMWIIWMLLCL